ncbi:MAG: plastocyanin/azurin family copper-binding protein [Methanococcaceae archaeon]
MVPQVHLQVYLIQEIWGPTEHSVISFTQAGTFHYYCRIHSTMSGTITVQ